MKKILIFSILIVTIIITIGCDGAVQTTTNDEQQTTEENVIQLLSDPTFSQGFKLMGTSPVEDGREVKRLLDYGGEAVNPGETPWEMAQWWTPYNFVDALYEKIDGYHVYKNQSRTIKAKPEDEGYLYFELLGSEEYMGSTRQSRSENWPHVLIEQTFKKSQKINDLEALNIRLDVTVEKCIDQNGDAYDPELHAAQLLWYFTLNNVVDENADESQVGRNGDYLWFGVPIFDNRRDFVKSSAHVDSGFAGGTNKLIYSMGSQRYFDEPIEFGKTYTIEVDILPYLREAFVYAINNDALVNAQFENMEIGYMNFGWELPGAFDVSSWIQNMSVEAVLK